MNRFRRALVLVMLFGFHGVIAAEQRTHIVCPSEAPHADCAWLGGAGIQAAIDAAADGDSVILRAGHYTAAAYREVPYQEVIIRGFVVIDGKSLIFGGEPGAVLDGSTGVPTTAIVVRNAAVTVRGLTLTGFRYDVEEDDFYEGHGLFVIDGEVRAEDLTISKFQKMGLTGRGASRIDARRISIVDGHVGIWLHETAYLSLTDSIVSQNDSSAIAAYDDAVAHVIRCVFEGNLDDGLFSEHQATLYVSQSRIAGNRPYGARAVGDSTIWLIDSKLADNEKNSTGSRGRARVRLMTKH